MKEDVSRCVASVSGERAWTGQCSNPRGKGPDGLFCAVHEPVAEENAETWWAVPRGREPSPVKVFKSTKACIWTALGREAKSTEWRTVYRTKEEAAKVYLARVERRVKSAEDALRWAQEAYMKAMEKWWHLAASGEPEGPVE